MKRYISNFCGFLVLYALAWLISLALVPAIDAELAAQADQAKQFTARMAARQ